MGNARGVARDFDALEQRRMEAVALFWKGLNNSEIGRQLRVSNQTVSRWRRQYAEGGKRSLRQAGRAGRLPRLNSKQQKQLVAQLLAGPEKQGYETPLWTCPRVARLIQDLFQVKYHAGHVWKLLRQLGWSVQRPVGRAVERDEVAIAEWKQKTWPALKKRPNAKPGRSS